MNDYGYWFMTQPGLKDMRKALIYFEMNARNYPQSFNAWDSLGEAVLAQGDERRAAQYYCRSLQLNPGNGGAKKILAKLGAQCRGEP